MFAMGPAFFDRGSITPPITYAVWDSARCSSKITLSSGDTIATANASAGCVFSTNAITVDTYFEFVANDNGNTGDVVGCVIGDTTIPTSTSDSSALSCISAWGLAKGVYQNNVKFTTLNGATAGPIRFSVCVNPGSRKVWIKETTTGTYPFSGDPVAGTGETGTVGGSSYIYALANPYVTGTKVTLVSDPANFVGSAPSGYQAGF